MTEVRFHGRGGQGVVTASRLLANAAILEGKWIQAFPEFGPERAGAPIKGFTRISDEKFTIKSAIYTPDVVAVIDPTLPRLVPVTEGLKEDGVLVINTPSTPEAVKSELNVQGTVGAVNATNIALETIGRPIANTAILGALVKSTNLVKLDSIIEALLEIFKGGVGQKNVEAIKRSYEEVKVA
ncbi:MAG: 2-oxoacid:acceptor oxidoreductase family protein [Promethearchaeota archaeon]